MKGFLLSSMVLAVLCSGCAVSSPEILLAGIEWQSQDASGQYLWQKYSRSGKMLSSPALSRSDFKDFMRVEEKRIPEDEIAEIWTSAGALVVENPEAWGEQSLWLGEGFEQLTINFCHYRLGWQVLSLSWPLGEQPEKKSTAQLLLLLRAHGAAAEPWLKTENLIDSSPLDLDTRQTKPRLVTGGKQIKAATPEEDIGLLN